jgi:hypothetical protein
MEGNVLWSYSLLNWIDAAKVQAFPNNAIVYALSLSQASEKSIDDVGNDGRPRARRHIRDLCTVLRRKL